MKNHDKIYKKMKSLCFLIRYSPRLRPTVYRTFRPILEHGSVCGSPAWRKVKQGSNFITAISNKKDKPPL